MLTDVSNILLKFPRVLTRPRITNGYENRAVDDSNPMMGKHNCPCCSYILLRHIRLGGLYWRCSHCYQEMPAL